MRPAWLFITSVFALLAQAQTQVDGRVIVGGTQGTNSLFPGRTHSETAADGSPNGGARLSGHQAYWVEQLAGGLKYPFSMAWLPDGGMLITERQGGLRIFRNGALDPKPLAGVPASFQNAYNGLKDVLLDPDFPTNRTLYLLISEGTYEQHHTAVYRARYRRTGLAEVNLIFRARDDLSGAGPVSARMIFLPDKTLLIGVPENSAYMPLAQRLDSHVGKMVRINRDGSIPQDNPFLESPDALPEIWSYGHRTPTGLYWDALTQSVWELEPGPRGGDELNLLKPGSNYGWAKASWGFDYSGGLVAPQQFGPGIEDPVLVWTPSVTPSGLTRYHGATYPAWEGDFFVGYLSGKALERLRIVGRTVVLRETMLMDLEERIREVKVGPDHYLYILTDHPQGRVLRLRPGRPRTDQLGRVAVKLKATEPIVSAPNDLRAADPVKGRQGFMERCAGCHRVGRAVVGGDIGPDLAGAYGRRAGSAPGFNFSAAMAASWRVWRADELDRFLADPARDVPGTTMTAPPLIESEVRRQIIEFIKQQSVTP